jgi:hypothetical protein
MNRRITAFGRFLWDFVVGDDWRIALAVIIALAVTALMGRAAWFILPLVVAVVLGYSVFEVARDKR